MKQVHLTLYGKGGTGKSFVAFLIAQYLRYRKYEAACEEAISPPEPCRGNYDYLFNRVVEEDKNFVIDNDTNEFLLLRQYLLEADILGLIYQHGKRVVVHVVLINDPVAHSHLELALSQMPQHAHIVVWLNEVLGEFADFEKTDVYLKNKGRIHQIVLLEKQNPRLISEVMEKMLAARLTFEEASMSPSFSVSEKRRLHQVKEGIFRQLEEII